MTMDWMMAENSMVTLKGLSGSKAMNRGYLNSFYSPDLVVNRNIGACNLKVVD